MTERDFFLEVCAKGGLPEYAIDALDKIYKNREALYWAVDHGGPVYTEEWREAGLTDEHLYKIRASAIRMREKNPGIMKRKSRSCTIQ